MLLFSLLKKNSAGSITYMMNQYPHFHQLIASTLFKLILCVKVKSDSHSHSEVDEHLKVVLE